MNFNHPTLITLTAPTCSGKSYLLDALTKDWCSRIVSTTTRPARHGECEGVDYHFISVEESRRLEAAGDFFELIEFNGTRYGVTNHEMQQKMAGGPPPVVILEPQGLDIYQAECAKRGWSVFKVFVSTTESVRIDRLNQRTTGELRGGGDIEKQVKAHTQRLLSITGDERHWINRFNWDVVVPGDDVEKALRLIQEGVAWRNWVTRPPRPYLHQA